MHAWRGRFAHVDDICLVRNARSAAEARRFLQRYAVVIDWKDEKCVVIGMTFVAAEKATCSATQAKVTRPGLEPGISGSGGRRLIH